MQLCGGTLTTFQPESQCVRAPPRSMHSSTRLVIDLVRRSNSARGVASAVLWTRVTQGPWTTLVQLQADRLPEALDAAEVP